MAHVWLGGGNYIAYRASSRLPAHLNSKQPSKPRHQNPFICAFTRRLFREKISSSRYLAGSSQRALRLEHVAKIVELLGDEQDDVRYQAVELLHQEMGSDALMVHWDKILLVFHDKSRDVRRVTAELLVDKGWRLPRDHIANYSELFAELVWSRDYDDEVWDVAGFLGAGKKNWQSPRKAEILEVISKLPGSALAQHRILVLQFSAVNLKCMKGLDPVSAR